MQGLVRDDCRTADSVICAINDAIAERIGQQKFRIWFKNSTRLTLTDDQIEGGVANQFISTWLKAIFKPR